MRFTRHGLILSLALLMTVLGRPDRSVQSRAAEGDALRVVRQGSGGEISATFDRPMIEPDRIGTFAPLEADVAGYATWTTVVQAVFHPLQRLPAGRDVTVRVPPVAALDGKQLASPVTWTVRAPALEVEGWLPSETGPRPRFELRFDRPVDPADVARSACFVGRDRDLPARLVGAAIEPPRSLPLGSSWTLVLEEGLKAKDGTELVSSWVHPFTVCSAPRLLKATGQADVSEANSISLSFNNPIPEKELLPRLQVKPSVDYTVSVGSRGATLTGPFAAGATYWIQIQEGALDAFGLRLAAEHATVSIPAYAPTLDLVERGWVVERFGPRLVPLLSVNVPRAQVSVLRLVGLPWEPVSEETLSERAVESNHEPNEIYTTGVELPGPGRFRVVAESAELRLRTEAAYLVTDLAPTFKRGRGKSLAAVTSLDTAEPREGVDVSLHDGKGALLWKGLTGPDGLADVPDLAASPVWLVARGFDDLAWLNLNSGSIPAWRMPVDCRPVPKTELEVFLMTDRPLYRPGETIHVKGWRRGASSEPLTLELRSWRDAPLERIPARVSEQGGFDGSFRLPPQAAPGGYRILARAGPRHREHSFQVGMYRAPSFEVRLFPAKPAAFPRETVEFEGEVRTFFGAPLAGARVRWSAYEDSGATGQGQAEVDARGRFSFRYPVGPGEGTLVATATVTDAAHQSVTAESAIPVRPAAIRLEASLETRRVRAGRPAAAAFQVRRLDGSADPREVSFRFIRRTWSRVQQLTAGRGWCRVWDHRDELVAMGLASGGRWEGTPVRPGPHLLELRARDEAGREVRAELPIDVEGEGEGGWEPRNDRLIDLVPDRPAYRPGETARVLARGAPPGSKALLTLEREDVSEARWVEIEGDGPVFEIPIREEHLPNVHLGVLFLRGRGGFDLGVDGEDLGRPLFGYGFVTLAIDTADRRLPVEVCVPAGARPGSEVSLELRTHPGAEVAVAVADEAVLALGESELPDPHEYFHAPRPLEVTTAESRPSLAVHRPMDVRGKKGRTGGGGGDGDKSGGPRRNFASTAFWNPSVRADGTGRAHVSFRLPDNLTRWRVLAVAAAAGRWGTGVASFRTEKPLMLLSAFPRFALRGDAFTGRLLVHNGTGAAGRAIVELDGSTREVDVAAGGSTPVDFPIETGELGPRRFRATARLGGHEDRLEFVLPVRFPGAQESAIVKGRGEGDVDLPPMAAVESVQLTVAATEAAWLEPELKRLLEYPHGCVEQTSSKTLPLLVLRRLGIEGTETLIEAGISRLLSMQLGAGGFSYWPGGTEPHAAGSVFASHVLALADRTGVAVPRPALERAMHHLEDRLRSSADLPRSHALYVLALGGRRIPSYLESLRPDPYLALAALEMRRPDRALHFLERPLSISLRTVHDFDSDARTAAARVLARARLRLRPDVRPEELLSRSLRTFERAWSLLALEALLGEGPAEAPRVRVLVDGRTVLDRPVDGIVRIELPPGRLRIEGDVCFAVRVKGSRGGDGPEDRGFWIRRTYTRVGESRPRTEFAAGDLVCVRVTMASRGERSYVALEDPLPAGFEPIELSFRTEDARAGTESSFGYLEKRDDRVFASSMSLGSGVHEMVYLARATTAGKFSAPASHAEEMYAPEVRGRGGPASVEIR